jgi:membrane-bound lytic murein transglycosylase D
MGLPKELAALPHVESSFNTYAYSRVGAAGMWQFMRSTGRRFLRIDNTVDERLDPYKATEAAASFLEQNYSVLGSWPLALTAYNHGTAGMRRAKEQLNTDDIAIIVRKYDSKTFGFASRNFYVAFLAALEVDSDPEKFFPGVRRSAADSSQVVVLSEYMSLPAVARALNVDADELHRMNPALLSSVVNGSRRIPRGFELRIPAQIDFDAALARLPNSERHAEQVVDRQHRVRRGETVASIAQSYRVNVAQLADLNGLRKPYRVRVGQTILLPEKEPAAPAPILAANTASPPTPVSQVASKQQPVTEQSAPSDGKYIVRPGDTLSAIATKVGMTEEELISLNRLRDRDYLYQGQVLAITSSAVASKPPEVEVQPPPAVVAEVAQQLAAKKEAEKAEPASESEAESQGPALLPGVQATASADPSDYSVHKGDTIQVEAAETIGHYADWLEVGATRLRQLNHMSKASPVVVGRRIKLDFSKVSVEAFEVRRAAYHRQLQEAFFSEYRIEGSETHTVKTGESIWVLAQKKYNVPIWLLRQYNPDVDMAAVKPGTRIVIPKIAPANSGAST